VAVAFSGGRDSTALLHATVQHAQLAGIEVLALHVHHGLSVHADAWLRHVQTLCRRWARRGKPVRLVAEILDTRPRRGESVEAWARRERYRALVRMANAEDVDLVLLAHHRRDQAETFLLQSLRGGGVAALSSMPSIVRREGILWARPWLATSSEAIDNYVRAHRLRHVVDDTNDDARFARNRLRATVWPALQAAFPDVEATLAAAAQRVQDAAAALDEWARIDLANVEVDGALDIRAWRALSPARQRATLRAWLIRNRVEASHHLLDRLGREIDARSTGRWPVDEGELRGHRGRLRMFPGPFPLPLVAPGCTVRLDLRRPGLHRVPGWPGQIAVETVTSGGLPVSVAAEVDLRARQPGDRFQSGAGRPARSLKLQYQAAGLPAWERCGPIGCSAAQVVFVAGLGIDARAIARPGQPQVTLTWLPD